MLFLFTHLQGVKSNNLGAPTHGDGDNSLAIGSSATWFGLNCYARVSSVRIYDRVLTDAEINEEVGIGAGAALGSAAQATEAPTSSPTGTPTIGPTIAPTSTNGFSVSSQQFNAFPLCLTPQMTIVSRGARTSILTNSFSTACHFLPTCLPSCPPRLLTPLL